MTLDPRKQLILKAVIFEYVSSAEPVGSETIARRYALGVRSATVRNELAEMAEMGYLEQPHTSAGRIPSDVGYRFYVDNLRTNVPPEAPTRQRVRSAAEEGEALRDLLRETTKVLSRLTHLLTAATLVRDVRIRVRNAVVSALGPDRALLVLVLNNGNIENRVVECPPGLTLEDIGQANHALSSAVEGKTLGSLARVRAPERGHNALGLFLASLFGSVKSVARDLTHSKLITEGEEYMLAQPEFQRDASRLLELIRALENEDEFHRVIANPQDQAKPVTIGKENRAVSFHPFTVIRERFYVGEDEAGTLAIIGPTRMDYDSSMPLLNFAAQAISETLTKLLK
jgi:heat-inducible transcriptional repressor